MQKHPLPLRIFHWINMPVLSLMIWSGILIYWAHQPYVRIPDQMAKTLHIEYRLAEGMGWHFFLMWIFFLNGLGFVTYAFVSGHWRELVPGKKDLKDFVPFVLSDLHLTKRRFEITEKYNPAQKVAYTGALFMGLGALVTGLAIYKPVQVGWLTRLLGGYATARFEHFFLMAALIFFIMVHLLQVIRSGWPNLRSMITGHDHE